MKKVTVLVDLRGRSFSFTANLVEILYKNTKIEVDRDIASKLEEVDPLHITIRLDGEEREFLVVRRQQVGVKDAVIFFTSPIPKEVGHD